MELHIYSSDYYFFHPFTTVKHTHTTYNTHKQTNTQIKSKKNTRELLLLPSLVVTRRRYIRLLMMLAQDVISCPPSSPSNHHQYLSGWWWWNMDQPSLQNETKKLVIVKMSMVNKSKVIFTDRHSHLGVSLGTNLVLLHDFPSVSR